MGRPEDRPEGCGVGLRIGRGGPSRAGRPAVRRAGSQPPRVGRGQGTGARGVGRREVRASLMCADLRSDERMDPSQPRKHPSQSKEPVAATPCNRK